SRVFFSSSARHTTFSRDCSPDVCSSDLYSHQADAWHAAARGEHLAIATPAASGKSLCYTLPVVAAAMGSRAKALYLFPTKALAQDRKSVVQGKRGHHACRVPINAQHPQV